MYSFRSRQAPTSLERRRIRFALCALLAVGLTLAACDDEGGNEVTEEDALDMLSDTAADANADTGSPDAADTTADTGTPDTGTPDTGVPDTGQVDTMMPPFDCAAVCVDHGEFIQDCVDQFIGGGFVPGAYKPARRSIALEVAEIDAATIAEVRAIVGAQAKIDGNESRDVLIIDDVESQAVREALVDLPGVQRELPAVLLGRQRAVALPEIIVRVEPGHDIESVIDGLDVHVVREHRLSNVWIVALDNPDADVLTTASLLDARTETRWAETNFIRTYETHADPYFNEQWHLENTGQGGAVPGIDVLALEAWDVTTGSTDVTIAVHDDGVDIDHPDLSSKIVIAGGTRSSEQALRDALAQGAGVHGTAVAGVAAATADNDRGGRGVCPDCSVMPIHIEGGFFEGSLNLEDAIVAEDVTLAVDQGADVINASWGPAGGDPSIDDSSLFPPSTLPLVIGDAFNHALNSGRGGLGTLIVYAAGNANQDTDSNPYLKHPVTVTVAAYDDQGLKTRYSDFGEEVDVTAPSSGGLTTGILTTLPTQGSGQIYDSLIDPNLTGADGDTYTRRFGGTSSAAPVVSGVIGLMLSVNPDLTADEIKQILHDTSIKIDRLEGEYDENGHSRFYGYGAVNAYAAVLAAQNLAGTCDTARTEECNGVDDNCDGTIDEGCTPAADCEPCLADAMCESGVCARPPNDLDPRCVQPCASDGTCDTGYECVNDYCVPETTGRCGECLASEECNGVDDTCDGVVDGSQVCGSAINGCRFDSQCGLNSVCTAAGQCATLCATTDDCMNPGEECTPETDRYGRTNRNICYIPQVIQFCVQMMCVQVPEEDREEVADCIADAADDQNCFAAYFCIDDYFQQP